MVWQVLSLLNQTLANLTLTWMTEKGRASFPLIWLKSLKLVFFCDNNTPSKQLVYVKGERDSYSWEIKTCPGFYFCLPPSVIFSHISCIIGDVIHFSGFLQISSVSDVILIGGKFKRVSISAGKSIRLFLPLLFLPVCLWASGGPEIWRQLEDGDAVGLPVGVAVPREAQVVIHSRVDLEGGPVADVGRHEDFLTWSIWRRMGWEGSY